MFTPRLFTQIRDNRPQPADDNGRSVKLPRWFMTAVLVTALAGLQTLAAAPAHAAPGDLDPTFDADGLVITDFATMDDSAAAVAIQSDGKIITVGRADESGNRNFALARYNTNGSLDITFDTDGKVTTDFAGGEDSAAAVAIQADGKIVVAGFATETGNRNFALARYNTNGSLDNTFDTDGKVTTDFSGDDSAAGVAIQADGKIVAVGVTGVVTDFALARYNTNGSLDNTFDTDGKVTTDFDGDADGAAAVKIQADGKIVAAGQATDVLGNRNFGLARYNTNGSLDNTFDTDGKVTTDFAGSLDQAFALAIQADGKIVAAGLALPGPDFALARYNTNGSLDTGFDTDGKVTTDFAGESDVAFGVAIQANGKIVAAGLASVAGDSNFGLARYNTNGSLDNTFSVDGKVTTDFGSGINQAFGVAIQPDGKIVAAGETSTGDLDFAVARYDGDALPPVATADLSITKADSPDPASVGGVLTYTLTVANAGPDPATGVMVSDTLPASVTVISATPSQGTCIAAPITTCNLGTLPFPGMAATVTIVVEPQTAGSISDTATVSSPVSDPNPANNTDTEPTMVNANPPGCTITGTAGNDSLAGTAGNDVICGLGGNDNISAGNGNDTIDGGPGNDNISGGDGNDIINGGPGDDKMSGDAGNDTINSGTGSDVASGAAGDDTLNSIDGVPGNDTNSGGAGNDTCNFDPGDTTSC